MRRREFATLLTGAVIAVPLAAPGQQLPVVGLLSSRSPATDAPLIAIIRQALNEMGFVEGQNVAIDYRWAEGQYDLLPGLAADLVRRQVAVVVTIGGDPSALAAKAATATIPIVCIVSDPVRSGLVNNLHRPGGNLTGASPFLDDLGPKRLELVRELRPKAEMIAILVNPNLPTAEKELADIQVAARGRRASRAGPAIGHPIRALRGLERKGVVYRHTIIASGMPVIQWHAHEPHVDWLSNKSCPGCVGPPERCPSRPRHARG
jgi:putative ABC transport system substrate-binding protein